MEVAGRTNQVSVVDVVAAVSPKEINEDY